MTMVNFAFVSRHQPTEQQRLLAREKGVGLVHVGDCDAFSPQSLEKATQGFAGAVVVHPAAALALAGLGHQVGVFKIVDRDSWKTPGIPDFSEFRIWDLRSYWTGIVCAVERTNASTEF